MGKETGILSGICITGIRLNFSIIFFLINIKNWLDLSSILDRVIVINKKLYQFKDNTLINDVKSYNYFIEDNKKTERKVGDGRYW